MQPAVFKNYCEVRHVYVGLDMSKGIASLVASVETKLEAHFSPFAELFRSSTRSVENSAKRYLRGLYQARRRNMERMVEVAAGSHYQRVQHMLSVSDWDHAGVVRQVAVQAQAHFPKGSRALVIDERRAQTRWLFSAPGRPMAMTLKASVRKLPLRKRSICTSGEPGTLRLFSGIPLAGTLGAGAEHLP